MTQKHYVAVAATIAARVKLADDYTPQTREILRAEFTSLADSFAGTFARDNPRFDRSRFLAACGLAE